MHVRSPELTSFRASRPAVLLGEEGNKDLRTKTRFMAELDDWTVAGSSHSSSPPDSRTFQLKRVTTLWTEFAARHAKALVMNGKEPQTP